LRQGSVANAKGNFVTRQRSLRIMCASTMNATVQHAAGALAMWHQDC
jgi:hypothetical protein